MLYIKFLFFSGIGKIWSRLFDHRGFLEGEINFFHKEFEQKRADKEVVNLFFTVEVINDICYKQSEGLKQAVDQTLPIVFEELKESLDLCKSLIVLGDSYKEDQSIRNNQLRRKLEWDEFIDKISSEYSRINCEFEEKEGKLKKQYLELRDKLKVLHY